MGSPATSAPRRFKLSAKYILALIGLIFVISLSIFTLTELAGSNDSADDDAKAGTATVVRILLNTQKSTDEAALSNDTATNKFVLINVQQKNDTQRLLSAILQAEQQDPSGGQRPVRQAPVDDGTNATQSSSKHSAGGYYEEQRPVVVHAENLPVLSHRQNGYGPPTAYYEDNDDDDEGERDGDGDGDGYYQQSSNSAAEQQPERYYDDEHAAQYETASDVGEGRAANGGQFDSYYRQWHYATPAPSARQHNSEANMGGNRKLQPTYNHDPYAAYDSAAPMSDYDYPAAPVPTHKERPQPGEQQHQQQEQQLQTQRRPQSMEKQPVLNTENTLLSTLKSLKTMWDIYQAFTAAWNVVAVHRQNQEQQQQKQQQKQQLKRKQQQQQQNLKSRINSKKPPKFNSSNNNNNNSRVKGTRPTKGAATVKSTSTTTTTTTTAPEGAAADSESSVELTPASKVEPRRRIVAAKGDAATQDDTQGVREKRQMTARPDTKADASEGRYIKGDPLKGYYDFVITEGSYKFWAAFQTGTALLIIYSTFAAIYYSKVNPLVGDYDYTDYLGGARSLSGGDADFVDDTDDDETAQRHNSRWFNWLPRTGHSLKFIFDALDKLPVDHKATNESNDEVAHAADDGEETTEEPALTGSGEDLDDLAPEDTLANVENT